MQDNAIQILLVEDDPDDERLVRALLREALFPTPLQIHHVDQLGGALQRLQLGGIDLILLGLPRSNVADLEIVARTLEASSGLPLVVLVAEDDESRAIRAIQLGAQDYLVKGQIERRGLVKSIRTAIERKRIEARERQALLVQIREQAERAKTAEHRSRFLAKAGRARTDSLDLETTLHALTRVAVPELAHFCVIDLLGEGGYVRRVAAAHADPALQPLLLETFRCPPELSNPSDPLAIALQTGAPAIVPLLDEALFGTTSRGQEQRRLFTALRLQSLMAVPLLARGRTLGAMTFFSTDAARGYSSEDLVIAGDLANQAALSIDGSLIYQESQQMVAVVTHDLRNPLNVITMGAASLRRNELSQERRTSLLDRIERSAVRMDRQLQDLLDLSRIDGGLLQLTRERIVVAPLIAEIVEKLRALIDQKHLHFEVELAPTLPVLQLDRERILQVLSNLLGNAIKFTPEGGRVALSVVQEEQSVRFTVVDTGAGIAGNALVHLFDRVYQARRTDRKGTGFGLPIARGIVLAHGGRLWIESKEGVGSNVSFQIPTSVAPTSP